METKSHKEVVSLNKSAACSKNLRRKQKKWKMIHFALRRQQSIGWFRKTSLVKVWWLDATNLLREVNEAPSISVIVNESTDIAIFKKLMTYVQYVDGMGKVQDEFIQEHDVKPL